MRYLIILLVFFYSKNSFSIIHKKKTSSYEKLIENCADTKSSASVYEALVREKKKYQKNKHLGEDFVAFEKRHIKVYENFYDLKFDEKKSWDVYWPSVHQCEQDFEKDPTKFKIRWE